ncbi:Uncharacterised protein [uncultured archaeon]|nr:Uncharacterised protein [uncultured archaeon]
MVTHAPFNPVSASASFTASSICRMGEGFIAGMPFFDPIPVPAFITRVSCSLASAMITMPRVTSDAWPPESFTAEALPFSALTGRTARIPAGVDTETSEMRFFIESTEAFAAAAAVVPVVYPRLRSEPSERIT